MASPNSTTLVLVGEEAPTIIDALGRFANVRAASLPDATDDEVQQWISQARSPYVVHDRDPLNHVASAWVEFFDDLTTLGTLDLEVDRAIASLGRGTTSLPDYYVILDAETLAPTWKHWWLGVLAEAAPTRIILGGDPTFSLARTLRRLPTGRSWPEPVAWLHRVARAVPDRVGIDRDTEQADDEGTAGLAT
ncbi:MAG: hypothetical protein JWN09_1625 [Microbacteriaceae bacterium]|jgi:hypothetical protein|nr:hypothetical protein [Microbacteriaceae bacterium]